MSGSNCRLLTHIQISQQAGKVFWYSHLFKNFPSFVVIYTVKGFDVVNKAEVGVFLELSCFFNDPTDDSNLISAFSKSSLNLWKFLINILLKSGLENFEHYFTSMWDDCNCAVVWTLFGIAFLWDWKENWPFPVLWPLLSFPNLLAYWVQHNMESITALFELEFTESKAERNHLGYRCMLNQTLRAMLFQWVRK